MLKQLGDALPEGVAVRPMGEQRLKDIERPELLREIERSFQDPKG